MKFHENSQLETICDEAFSQSSIEIIVIPQKVASIGNDIFSDCRKLKRVAFTKNSQLNTIGDNVFSNTKIESLCLPSQVSNIGNDAFYNCDHLQIIEFSEKLDKNSVFDLNLNDCQDAIIMIHNR